MGASAPVGQVFDIDRLAEQKSLHLVTSLLFEDLQLSSRFHPSAISGVLIELPSEIMARTNERT